MKPMPAATHSHSPAPRPRAHSRPGMAQKQQQQRIDMADQHGDVQLPGAALPALQVQRLVHQRRRRLRPPQETVREIPRNGGKHGHAKKRGGPAALMGAHCDRIREIPEIASFSPRRYVAAARPRPPRSGCARRRGHARGPLRHAAPAAPRFRPPGTPPRPGSGSAGPCRGRGWAFRSQCCWRTPSRTRCSAQTAWTEAVSGITSMKVSSR